jgi:hypothetical protein
MIINTSIIIILIVTRVGNEMLQRLLHSYNLKSAEQMQDVSLNAFSITDHLV